MGHTKPLGRFKTEYNRLFWFEMATAGFMHTFTFFIIFFFFLNFQPTINPSAARGKMTNWPHAFGGPRG